MVQRKNSSFKSRVWSFKMPRLLETLDTIGLGIKDQNLSDANTLHINGIIKIEEAQFDVISVSREAKLYVAIKFLDSAVAQYIANNKNDDKPIFLRDFELAFHALALAIECQREIESSFSASIESHQQQINRLQLHNDLYTAWINLPYYRPKFEFAPAFKNSTKPYTTIIVLDNSVSVLPTSLEKNSSNDTLPKSLENKAALLKHDLDNVKYYAEYIIQKHRKSIKEAVANAKAQFIWEKISILEKEADELIARSFSADNFLPGQLINLIQSVSTAVNLYLLALQHSKVLEHMGDENIKKHKEILTGKHLRSAMSLNALTKRNNK